MIENLVSDPNNRSNTTVCSLRTIGLTLNKDEQTNFIKNLLLLEEENAAFDIKGHRNAPPGLRIWCGATVNRDDIQNLLPWLDWCFKEIISMY